MSSSNEDVIKQLLEELSRALQLKLPLGSFSQLYEDAYFDNLAQHEAKQVMAAFQASSKLNMSETFAIVNELFPKMQDVIREWKAKNGENKTKCEQFLQSQVDFLLADFRTSVFIKLVSAPDAGLQDLESFLEGRKIVLIDVFDKLSKPGEPQSSENMKTKLGEKLEHVKMETLEKQRLHLEQKATDKAKKVLEDTKGIIMKKARQLQSDLRAYHGNDPNELVRVKLGEINYFLSLKGKGLDEHYPNIYSAVLRTTAEVRKCLDEDDYKDMSAAEFAETLHEQLLFDFAEGNHVRRNSCTMDSDSFRSSDESACANSGIEEELLTDHNGAWTNDGEAQPNELPVDFAEEEGIKEEKEDERDLSTKEKDSNTESAFIQSANVAEEGENELEERNESFENNLKSGIENPSKKQVARTTQDSSRRSARLQVSSAPFSAKHSKRKSECVAVYTKETRDAGDDIPFESSRDDDYQDETGLLSSKRSKAGSSKPSGRKLHRSRKHPLNNDKSKSNTDKISYLHLNGGRPVYRCNVCKRKCFQNVLQYHGEHCGKKEMPFNCDECGMGFVRSSNLKSHERIHMDERSYKCPKCSESFKQPSGLNHHIRSHKRGTRFACKVCKMRFISPQRLHDHNKSMHKEKFRFGCVYCDDRFNKMSNLCAHVISHSDICPFRCPSCNSSATSKYILAQHIQKCHSQPMLNAQRLADEAAIAYLVKETKNEAYRDLPKRKINSLVVSHVIKKVNLKLPRNARRSRKSSGDT